MFEHSKTGDDSFTKDKFIYNHEEDVYICPMGNKLKRVSKTGGKRTRYRGNECKDCPHKAKCTTNKKGREVSPTEYQEYYDRADKLFADNLGLYKQRQIVEHPFGTIKRSLGYTYFLMRGHEKVEAETYMHFFTYNLKRVINILGIAPLLDALKEKYRKIAELELLLLVQIFCIYMFLPLKMKGRQNIRNWLSLVV
jgi:hypothetical protein